MIAAGVVPGGPTDAPLLPRVPADIAPALFHARRAGEAGAGEAPAAADALQGPRDRPDDALHRRRLAHARVARTRGRLHDDAQGAERSARPDRLRPRLRQRLLHA